MKKIAFGKIVLNFRAPPFPHVIELETFSHALGMRLIHQFLAAPDADPLPVDGSVGVAAVLGANEPEILGRMDCTLCHDTETDKTIIPHL